MVEALTPPPPVSPVITIRPVEIPTLSRDATQVQTALAVLPPGTVVQGFVLNRDAQNNPILRTPQGDVQVQSDVFLKTGSQVTIQVDAGNTGSARIINVDGQTLQQYAANATRGLTEDTVAPSTVTTLPQPAANAAAPIQNNASFTATLLSRAVTATPSTNPLIAGLIGNFIPPNLQKLAAGQPLKVTLTDFQLPAVEAPANAPAANTTPTPPPLNPQLAATSQPDAKTPTPSTAPANPNAANIPTAPVSPQPASAPVNPAPALAGEALPAPTNTTPAPPPSIFSTAPAATNAPLPAVSTNPQTSPIVQAALAATAAQPSVNASILSTPPTNAAPPAPTNPSSPPPNLAATNAAPPPSPQNATPLSAAAAYAPRLASAAYQQLATPNAYPTAPAAATPASPLASASTSTPTTAPPPTPNGVQAVVIGGEADGASVLHSALGVVKLYTPQSLPIGSRLTLDIEPDPTRPVIAGAAVANPASAPTPPLTASSRAIPWVAELAEQLSGGTDKPATGATASAPNMADSAALRTLLQRIPTTDAGFTSSMLSYIAGVKSGDIRQWVDKRTLEILTSDFPKIATKLTTDTAQMQQLWNHSPIENWAGILIPIFAHGQLDYAKLYVRDDEEQAQAAAGGGKRFVVELNLSQLGDMQFDGFVRNAQNKQFDLMIRTVTPIDAGLANTIRTIFDNSMQTTGYSGYLGFQHGAQHFIRPLADLKPLSAEHLNTILA